MTVVSAGAVDAFDEDTRRLIEIDGVEVVVFSHGQRFYALENTCLHMGGPVGQGIVLGRVEAVLAPGGELIEERFSETEIHIVCPWHGWEYDIENGAAAGDRSLCLRTWRTEVRDGTVYIHA